MIRVLPYRTLSTLRSSRQSGMVRIYRGYQTSKSGQCQHCSRPQIPTRLDGMFWTLQVCRSMVKYRVSTHVNHEATVSLMHTLYSVHSLRHQRYASIYVASPSIKSRLRNTDICTYPCPIGSPAITSTRIRTVECQELSSFGHISSGSSLRNRADMQQRQVSARQPMPESLTRDANFITCWRTCSHFWSFASVEETRV